MLFKNWKIALGIRLKFFMHIIYNDEVQIGFFNYGTSKVVQILYKYLFFSCVVLQANISFENQI